MAGGWWYCDLCSTDPLVMQELEKKRPPEHEGETNMCPSCGTVWTGSSMEGVVATLDGGTPTLCWSRPKSAEA